MIFLISSTELESSATTDILFNALNSALKSQTNFIHYTYPSKDVPPKILWNVVGGATFTSFIIVCAGWKPSKAPPKTLGTVGVTVGGTVGGTTGATGVLGIIGVATCDCTFCVLTTGITGTVGGTGILGATGVVDTLLLFSTGVTGIVGGTGILDVTGVVGIVGGTTTLSSLLTTAFDLDFFCFCTISWSCVSNCKKLSVSSISSPAKRLASI